MQEAVSGALALDNGACRAAAVAGVRSADLAAVGLTKSFDPSRFVLKDINFEIYPREAVGLIGANGSGKSTLLRCCVGLTPIDGGTVRLLGEELSSLRARELRRLRSKVGFIFQQHNLVPRLSVLTNVLHGSLARAGARSWFQAMAPRQERERAMHYLDLVGLADLPGRRADRLSGGQSQRVAIARALMQEPEMLVADEPVASLDPKAADEVMEAFVRLSQRARLTFVFTSHNLQHALTYADRLLGLRDGAITLDGASNAESLSTLRDFYDDPANLRSNATAAH
jgi:phosphonate transport system ATP-binding protein